jgi:hypothetical protein
MAIKIELEGNKIKLSLYRAQGGIRIADKNGNHVSSPTKTKNEETYYIEWMITNDEIKSLSGSILASADFESVIKNMQKINKFTEDSEYSQRKTVKLDMKEIAEFEGFKIYQYNEYFNSFEKTLNSGIKVRITFKLGDYGLDPHPHMYVLVPFNHKFLKIKNNNGDVSPGNLLGSGCYGELKLDKEDLEEIILTLSHASSNHRNALVGILKP